MSAGATTPASAPMRGRWTDALGRAIRQPGGRTLAVGVGLIAIVLLASILGRFLLPDPNQQDLQAALEPPSLEHPFGTDDIGRDVLSRTLAATWLDLSIGIGITVVAITIGLLIGTVAGYLRGWVDRVLVWLIDAVIGFPYLVFVLAVMAVVGPGTLGLFIGAVCATWAFYARLARGEMLVLRETPFMQAAQTLGYSPPRVMLRHAIPNLVRPMAVYSMSDVVANILAIAGLSFLGLGVPPPTPEWGAIIEDGRPYLLTAWWISTLPGLVVIIVGLGFVMIGDALGERLGIHQEAAA